MLYTRKRDFDLVLRIISEYYIGLWLQFEQKKKNLIKQSSRLIDLSHKIFICPDKPNQQFLNAIIPILSHDKYEVTYQYVDRFYTKTNIVRGWPVVITVQADNTSKDSRYTETKRRMPIANPKMNQKKYSAAINLISVKYGMPDFIFQQQVVSDRVKESDNKRDQRANAFTLF